MPDVRSVTNLSVAGAGWLAARGDRPVVWSIDRPASARLRMFRCKPHHVRFSRGSYAGCDQPRAICAFCGPC
jgi:hypothetical protein